MRTVLTVRSVDVVYGRVAGRDAGDAVATALYVPTTVKR